MNFDELMARSAQIMAELTIVYDRLADAYEERITSA